MENIYTVERVLLGLQKEYLETYQKINKLKEYCVVNNKKVLDYYFSLILSDNGEVNLYLEYEKRNRNIDKLLEKIKDKLSLDSLYTNWLKIVKNNGAYRISNPRFPIQIIKEDLLDFSDLVKNILSLDFAIYMDSKKIELEGLDKINLLTIAPSYLRIEQDIYNHPLWYNPYENIISFKNNHGIVDNAYIESLLKMVVPTSSLNPYEHEVINKSDADSKKIMIPEEIKEEESVTFNICSEQEGLVLTRVARKN